jgi:serine protease DegQ
MKRTFYWLIAVTLLAGMAEKGSADTRAKVLPAATKAGETKLVPYRLTTTKHVLVRAKFNGRGPYNLVIDTGAPVLILAKKVNDVLKIEQDKAGWGTVQKLEFEGGVVLDKATIRFDDLFQLEGMNGLGLAGVEIHGLVGYPILSQFRVTYDYAQPKLTWTKLDTETEELPRRPLRGGAPGGLDALGSVMKTVGKIFGMGPPSKLEPRGFVGFSVIEKDDQLLVDQVVGNGPADFAHLKANDILESVNDKPVNTESGLRIALAEIRAAEKIILAVKRGEKQETITIITGRGF